jgi:hypothetical protein
MTIHCLHQLVIVGVDKYIIINPKSRQIIVQNICLEFVTFLEAKGRFSHGIKQNYVNYKMILTNTLQMSFMKYKIMAFIMNGTN